MQIFSGKIPWNRLCLIAAGSALLLVATSHFVKSKNNTGQIYIPRHHATGHVHDHADKAWPPEPENAGNVIDYSKSGEDEGRHRKRKQKFDDLERNYYQRADIKDALGQKYTRVAFIEDEDKHRGIKQQRYTYFSRDKNKTVEIAADDSGVKAVKSIPANEYQPEITEEEITEATQLARAYFLSKGLDRVTSLKGYGIMAYSPVGKGFYDNRVIYISFHSAADAPPEFMAWVDLTNGKIIKSREEN